MGSMPLGMKVSQAIDYIGRHYAEPISLRDVADEVGLSPCHLAHLVKKQQILLVLPLVAQNSFETLIRPKRFFSTLS